MSTPELSKETVLAIHSAAVARFGGLDGVRDDALLESALGQPFQTFGGQDLYPGNVNKACRYAYGIIKNHPFADGNKRTATALLGTYLRLAGLAFRPNHDAFLNAMLSVADGTLNCEDFVRWVEREAGASA